VRDTSPGSDRADSLDVDLAAVVDAFDCAMKVDQADLGLRLGGRFRSPGVRLH
jgi:hypothetical protein